MSYITQVYWQTFRAITKENDYYVQCVHSSSYHLNQISLLTKILKLDCLESAELFDFRQSEDVRRKFSASCLSVVGTINGRTFNYYEYD